MLARILSWFIGYMDAPPKWYIHVGFLFIWVTAFLSHYKVGEAFVTAGVFTSVACFSFGIVGLLKKTPK